MPTANCHRLRPQQVAGDKEDIGGALAQSPHEIWVPFGAERNVNPNPPAFSHQTLLQVAADAVEHLKLERVRGYLFAPGESLGLAHNVLIVRSQAVIDPTLH